VEANELASLPDITVVNDNMKTLSFSENRVTAFPKGLEHISGLTVLRAEDNLLGVLSEDLGTLTQSNKLILARNRLTALPPVIGKLKFVSWCDLSNNQLTSLPEVCCCSCFFWLVGC